MKPLFRSLLLVALVLGLGACDSGDDSATDAELFVGTWAVTKITNNSSSSNPQDVTPLLFGSNGTVNSFTLKFNGNGTYELRVDYKNASQTDLMVPPSPQQASVFTYSLNEATGKLTLALPVGQGVSPQTVDYSLSSETMLTATIASQIMNSLFGTTLYQGNVAVAFVKQ